MTDTYRNIPSLSERYRPYFRIGAAVNAKSLNTHRDLLVTHFNSVTAENEMKWEEIHPEQDRYEFAKADALVNFAREHGMFVRGHTLVWHNQTPAAVFLDDLGQTATAAVVERRLEEHVATVLGRYHNDIGCWDVVNEAVVDAGTGFLRDSRWLQTLGDDYIAKAFRIAHQAAPDALLFYNDYNETKPDKSERIYKLVAGLLDEGVPIHGIGMQGHWMLDDPALDEIERAIDRYASLGVRLHITELDVSVYGNVHGTGGQSQEVLPYDDELAKRLAERYRSLFSLLRARKDVIESVTFWGVADDDTWRDNFPVRGRKDWPLLFDVNHGPKQAFWSVVEF
ncbi:beta-xylanase [Alicyclobacillus hesperidum]|uniref:Beta-xylanase n=1 Tax=Alicyclobacillus hesperidum TaxID=89784 RepID=A0AA37U6B0_9BACL|nr:endo-1,4-beta-xylanase [Alicyclobacillus hesperidum]GLV13324.1 beta-xylanase [Alicyclobacillus hesperidum]